MLEEDAPGVAIVDDQVCPAQPILLRVSLSASPQACLQGTLSPADFLGVTPHSLPTLSLATGHFLQAQAKALRTPVPPPGALSHMPGIAREKKGQVAIDGLFLFGLLLRFGLGPFPGSWQH